MKGLLEALERVQEAAVVRGRAEDAWRGVERSTQSRPTRTAFSKTLDFALAEEERCIAEFGTELRRVIQEEIAAVAKEKDGGL